MEKQPKKIIDYDNCESIDEINNLLCVNSDSQLNLTNKDITDKVYNATKWDASIYNFTGDITLVAQNNKDGIFHVHCSVYTYDDEFVGDFLLKSPILYKNDSKISSSEIFPCGEYIGVNQVTVYRNSDPYGEDKYYDEIIVDPAVYSQDLFNYNIDEFNIEDGYNCTVYTKSYFYYSLEFNIVPDEEYELYIDGELKTTAIAEGGIYNGDSSYEIFFDPGDLSCQVMASYSYTSYYNEGEVKLQIAVFDDTFTFSNITIKTKGDMIKTPLYVDVHNVYFQPIHLNVTHSFYDETKDVTVQNAPQ